jgi:hypothetical protein
MGSDNFFFHRGRGTTEDPLDFIQLPGLWRSFAASAAVKNPDPHLPQGGDPKTVHDSTSTSQH